MSAEVEAPSPLGIVGGSAFLEEEDPTRGELTTELREVATGRGLVTVLVGDGFIFLPRHGGRVYHPPHRIPHHAHVLALESLGVREVVGLASTGSLQEDLPPGTVVVPDDYLSRHAPPSFAADDYLHIVPELDGSLREFLAEAVRAVLSRQAGGAGAVAAGLAEVGLTGSSDGGRNGVQLRTEGVYAETRGPRFETRAEVRSLARDAQLVGMTAASEATLLQERGLRYAMLCIVDNWAHGLGVEPLTLEAFQARQKENQGLAREIFLEIIRRRRQDHPPASDEPPASDPDPQPNANADP